MKLLVHYQDKVKEYIESASSGGDNQISLLQVTEKICTLFSLPSSNGYSLFLNSGSIIDNLNLIEDGLELVLKPISGQSSSSSSTNHNNNGLSPTLSSISGASSSASSIGFSNSSIGGFSANGMTPPQQQQPATQVITIDSILNSLNDSSIAAKKKALFDLKDLLKDEVLVKKFVEKNGINCICNQISELSGNTLSYTLLAIQSIMAYESGASAIPVTLIKYILPQLESPNPSISKTTLSILYLFCNGRPQGGYRDLQEQFQQFQMEYQKSVYSILVSLLASSTVDVQLNSLTLINALISKSHPISVQEYQKILAELDSLDINSKLKKQIESNIATEFRKQLYLYQKNRLQTIKIRKSVVFNKENQEHEALLMRLWNATFPGVKLESRVSEQWKLLGFQGTDPCTDFRGMGMFGLENLVYFAEVYPEKFRKIVNSQVDRKEREYPTATGGINITQMLFEIFKINEEYNQDFPIFPILFSHASAFEEVYCTTFQILDTTWDEMMGSYMNWPKIFSSVKNQILTALESKPATLEAFHWAACLKNSNNYLHQNMEDDHAQTEDIKKLKQVVKKEILEMIKTQKIQYLATDGFFFKLQKPQKGKTSVLSFVFLKLSQDQTEVNYIFTPDNTEKPISFTNSVKISEITFNIDAATKKNNKSSVQYFSLTIGGGSGGSSGGKSTENGIGRGGSETLELISNTREDASNFSDALRCLMGKQIESLETIEEYKTLVNLSMKLKLLDIEGFDIPKETPKQQQTYYYSQYTNPQQQQQQQPTQPAQQLPNASNNLITPPYYNYTTQKKNKYNGYNNGGSGGGVNGGGYYNGNHGHNRKRSISDTTSITSSYSKSLANHYHDKEPAFYKPIDREMPELMKEYLGSELVVDTNSNHKPSIYPILKEYLKDFFIHYEEKAKLVDYPNQKTRWQELAERLFAFTLKLQEFDIAIHKPDLLQLLQRAKMYNETELETIINNYLSIPL
eukprot:gene854-1064_t